MLEDDTRKERAFQSEPFHSVGSAIGVLKQAFPGDYSKPWWGNKMTSGIRGFGTIHNLGYVIGFRDDAKEQRYRLDFDPNSDRQLHLNYQCDSPWNRVYFRIKPFVIAGGDEMWNYYCTWTTQHCEDVPDGVREKLGSGKIWRGRHWA